MIAIVSFFLTTFLLPSRQINLLGSNTADPDATLTQTCDAALSVPGTTLHLYGKRGCKPGRKMGHVTVVGDTAAEAFERARKVLSAGHTGSNVELKETEERDDVAVVRAMTPRPVVSIIMGSDSDLPTMKPGAEILRQMGVPFEVTVRC